MGVSVSDNDKVVGNDFNVLEIFDQLVHLALEYFWF